jgi:nucleotidyltransferase/DNA polymerase involved in DNA repair
MNKSGKLMILHVDMDAFFTAIEQLDNPDWRGKPLIVGAPPDRRGVVSTCSYEARVFGVHSAMPSRVAGKLCAQGIFVQPRMGRYEEVSHQIMTIFDEFTPMVEPVFLDEAFLDVSGSFGLWPDAVVIAGEIKRRIRERTKGLTASVGVARNKFLAKAASDLNKPDGITIVPDNEAGILSFLGPLPVTKLWGVGRVASERLHKAGIYTISQLQAMDLESLSRHFGKSGSKHIWELCRGIDDRPVMTDWDEKSISGEHTFDKDCDDNDIVRQVLLEQIERVGRRLRESGKMGRTVHIKVRFCNFRTITRQECQLQATNSDRSLRDATYRLFDREDIDQPVRLIGFGVSNLFSAGMTNENGQLPLPELQCGETGGDRSTSLDRCG